MSLLRDLENIGKRAPQTGFIFKRTSVSGGIQGLLPWADFHPLVSGNVKNKSKTAQATKKKQIKQIQLIEHKFCDADDF